MPFRCDFKTMITETSLEYRLILNEAGLTSSCLGEGLTVLRKADFVRKWNYYQSFFLISIGLERLLKLIIVSKHMSDTGTFPKNDILKAFSHDIFKAIKEVESYEIDSKTFASELDLSIISFFTNFAKKTRYYNLDTITGSTQSDDPLSGWDDIRTKIKNLENLVPKPLHPGLLNLIDQDFMIVHHDEKGNLVNNAADFYKDSSILDKLQGYSVYYIWCIISNLTEKLKTFDYTNNLPVFSEFFPQFNKNWAKKNEIIKLKKWNYLDR
jgi:hypothetical protein